MFSERGPLETKLIKLDTLIVPLLLVVFLGIYGTNRFRYLWLLAENHLVESSPVFCLVLAFSWRWPWGLMVS